MKKFANAEIEVVKFNNAVIATSGCAAVGYNGPWFQDVDLDYHVWNAESNCYFWDPNFIVPPPA